MRIRKHVACRWHQQLDSRQPLRLAGQRAVDTPGAEASEGTCQLEAPSALNRPSACCGPLHRHPFSDSSHTGCITAWFES